VSGNGAEPDASAASRGSPTLTFAGGGWVIALSGLLVLLVLGWGLLGPMLGHRPVGDGRTLESYQFDLSTLLIDRARLTPSGQPRGFLPSLDHPAHMRGAEMPSFNEMNRPKYVVSSDRIAGIVVNGQAHAWPLSLLNVHEVINDTVAGVPIAATYSPLCDSFIAFDRRVAGHELRFEVSGLLVNSNLVFYDKPADAASASKHSSSLFLQLERRAIAGPLAAEGVGLNPLPDACITTWSDWLALHPETTVTVRDPQMVRRMKEINYARYFLSPKLEYPADPMPAEADLASRSLRMKSPVLLLGSDSGWVVVAYEPAAAGSESSQLPSGNRTIRLTVDGSDVEVQVTSGPAVARARRLDGKPLLCVPCLYFGAFSTVGPREPLRFPK
jgi:Protein of unknown function (DUF3179)